MTNNQDQWLRSTSTANEIQLLKRRWVDVLTEALYIWIYKFCMALRVGSSRQVRTTAWLRWNEPSCILTPGITSRMLQIICHNVSFTLVFYQGAWKFLNLPMHCMYMMHKEVLLIGSENQLHQQDKYRKWQVINSGLQICTNKPRILTPWIGLLC